LGILEDRKRFYLRGAEAEGVSGASHDVQMLSIGIFLCLKGTNGMALVADSRGTFGDPRGVTAQNDEMQKVYSVTPYVGVLLAGSGEIGAMVIQDISKKLEEEPIDGVTPVMNLIREMLGQRYNEWFKGFQIRQVQGNTNPVRPTLSVIVGGYEISEGVVGDQKIYSLNSLNNFAPSLHDYGFSLDGVAQYGLYFLNRLYNNGMDVDMLLQLGAYCITETASQDGKVGGPVRAIKITSDVGCVELTQEEINTILEENKERTERLKRLFEG
jgi:20S proteasome alpha/beta subunit